MYGTAAVPGSSYLRHPLAGYLTQEASVSWWVWQWLSEDLTRAERALPFSRSCCTVSPAP